MKFQFSGHETFPLRQLWLLKAVDYVKQAKKRSLSHIFSTEQAMIDLGVGKNMVSSIRFWSVAAKFLEKKSLTPTRLALEIFGDEKKSGLDPFCENPATSWIVHWNLASSPDVLTIFWFLFNQVNANSITREVLHKEFREYTSQFKKNISEVTLKRDIEVCLRSYVPAFTAKKNKLSEEFVEPLLSDLGILEVLNRNVISVRRTNRFTLHDAVFTYALIEYWQKTSFQTATLDFHSIAYGIGAPGRVFKIDEISLVRRLENLEFLTDGKLIWAEQAGIRTLIRKNLNENNIENFKFKLLKKAY